MKEYPTTYYFGVDQKPKRGRLKIDSVRVLKQPGWAFDVVDIDTYGSPWKHYFALLPNVCRPLTVFFTAGQVNRRSGFGNVDNLLLSALGVNFPTLALPNSLRAKLVDAGFPYLLVRAFDYGLAIEEAMEAFPSKNARYIGLRLSPTSS